MRKFGLVTKVAAAAAAIIMPLTMAPAASAAPLFPGGPDIQYQPLAFPGAGSSGLPTLALPIPGPPRPAPNYSSVSIFPRDKEVVGVAEPIFFNFPEPIQDRQRAEASIAIRNSANVPGFFYWINDQELRWRPRAFWPANTSVIVETSAGQRTDFKVGDALVAEVDGNTKMITVKRNGQVVRTMRTSLGMPRYATYNGIYYTGQRGRDVLMDSTTFGLALDAGGYRSIVNDAIRLSYDGIYIHSAPWSVADQGVRHVSHGCINLSPEDAAWYYDNTRNGDPVIVKNSVGTQFGMFDGQGDWN